MNTDPSKTTSPKEMPQGLLMPMSIRDIDHGKLSAKLDSALAGTFESLDRFVQKTGDKRTAKAKIVLTIELSPSPDMEDHVNIQYQIKRSIPEPKAKSYCKAHGGILLTDATEESVGLRSDEEQISLFNFLGADAGIVNPKTMLLIEDTGVAGEINPA